VSSGAAEIALGKGLTYLNRYNFGRMLLAVIAAGGHAFFACFSCHLGFTSFPAQFAYLMVFVVFFLATSQA
jgi:hypothetical protein